MNYIVVNFIPLGERKPDTTIKIGFFTVPDDTRPCVSLATLVNLFPCHTENKKYLYKQRDELTRPTIKFPGCCNHFIIFKKNIDDELHGFHTYQLFSSEGRPISEETSTCDHPMFCTLDEEGPARTVWEQPEPVTHVPFFSDIATARCQLLSSAPDIPLLPVSTFNRYVATHRNIDNYRFGVRLWTCLPFIKLEDLNSPLLSFGYHESSLAPLAHRDRMDTATLKQTFDMFTRTSIQDLFLQYTRNLARIAFCNMGKIGLGVIATKPFEAGEFVGFYDGEWKANHSGYPTLYRKQISLTDHKHPDREYSTFADGLRCGSFINFINSAPRTPTEECEPATLIQLSVRNDRYTHNIFFARRRILPGEQLTWEYELHTKIKNIRMDNYGFNIEELEEHTRKGPHILIHYLANNQLKGFGELVFYLSLRELCRLAIALKLKNVAASLKTASTVIDATDETKVSSLQFK